MHAQDSPCSPRRVRLVARRVRRFRRLVGDDDVELGDLFADSESVDPEAAALDSVRGLAVRSAVGRLPDRERRIIELRFGFGGESASLETIGKELGLTRERVRQLESEALQRLQLELGDELVWAA